MTHLQEHWEGASLSGNYMLEQWLCGDDRVGFFQTSLTGDGRRAIAKLVIEAEGGDEGLLDLWHRIRQLRHPNLVELLDFGRAEDDGETVAYAIFEFPDDTLTAALSRAPLDQSEAREVLDTLLDALRYLHAQGLVLGALDADQIVAVGDRIKLSTDTLCDGGSSTVCREDVRLLGAFWRQYLLPASPRSSEIATHAEDPDPHTRWTLAEIRDALNPPLPITAAPIVAAPVPAAPIPSAPVAATPIRATQSPASEPSTHRFPKWILAGAAAVLLVITALHRPRPAAVSPTPHPIQVSLPTPVPKAVVTKSSPPSGNQMWRVIAYTYRSRIAAVKKVQQLNQRDPGLHASVFTPKEQSGYYLVSLGGRVTHEDAVRLQRSARSKGLPRDLYVQNYSE